MVKHFVIPFDPSVPAKEMQEWLGSELPAVRAGKLPTMNQLQVEVEHYAEGKYETHYVDTPHLWSVTLANGELWILTIELRKTSENEVRFTAEGDRFHLEEIVKNLPSDCGTLIVFTDGEDPKLILPGQIAS